MRLPEMCIRDRDNAMELKDYYAIMGVKPTDDLKTIKTAYRRLARKYHPDVSKEPVSYTHLPEGQNRRNVEWKPKS